MKNSNDPTGNVFNPIHFNRTIFVDLRGDKNKNLKDEVPENIEPATCRLVAQFLTQLRHRLCMYVRP
jgi:hypothetical protein